MTRVTAQPDTLMANVRPSDLSLILLGRPVIAQDGVVASVYIPNEET